MTPTYLSRPSQERGHADHGWLKAKHTFSFANYHDPKHVHFRALRVLNQDLIAPYSGFPTHPHEEMEIVTIVLSGELEHKDSTGNTGTLYPIDVQVMHAGTGLTHSEKNPANEWLHLLQIWVIPGTKGVTPSWQQRSFPMLDTPHDLLLCSPTEAENSLKIYQDTQIRSVALKANSTWRYALGNTRHAWLHMISGELTLDDTHTLKEGDSIGLSHTDEVRIDAQSDCRFVWFDLA